VNVTFQTFKSTFCKVVADAAALHPILLTCTLGCSSLTAGWQRWAPDDHSAR